jgi:hypothetical protein
MFTERNLADMIEELRSELCSLLSKYRNRLPKEYEKLVCSWCWWEYHFHEVLDEMKEDLLSSDW